MMTTRRKAMSAILGLGAGTALYSSTLDQAAWRATKLSKKPGFATVMRCWWSSVPSARMPLLMDLE